MRTPWSHAGHDVRILYSYHMTVLLKRFLRYPATWDLTQLTGLLAVPTEALATSKAGPSLRKRSRQRYEA